MYEPTKTVDAAVPEDDKTASDDATKEASSLSYDETVIVIDKYLTGSPLLSDYFPMLGLLYCQVRGLVLYTVHWTIIICGSVPKYFTSANIVKFLFLYWWFFSANKQDGSNHGAISSINHLQPKQHFCFGPFGFFPTTLESKHAQPLDSEKKKSAIGYYAIDIAALDQALDTHPNSKHCQVNTEKTVQSFNLENSSETKMAVDGSPFFECKSLETTTIVLTLPLGTDPRSEIDFVGDAVTFLIGYAQSRPDLSLEVVVRLESAGGKLHSYGLIAEQLKRLRSVKSGGNITLTVTCDLVAASGGYLIASTASPGQLLASPFAIIGSIGVVTQATINVQNALEQYGIKTIQVKSGNFKRPDSMLGTISDDDLQKMQQNLDRSHAAFGNHVMEWRGDVISDYDRVLSGDDWLGKDALELGLVDRLITSDEYLTEKVENGDRVIMLFKNAPANKNFWLRMLDVLFDGASNMDAKVALDMDSRLQSLLFVAKLAAEQLVEQ
jgi:serine protease SohB